MGAPQSTGFVAVNGMELYWERRGTGGTPLIVIHGGFGVASALEGLLDELAAHRRVIAVELQGHGHTKDIDRPFAYQDFGDDLAAVVDGLELGQVDLLGFSLGAGAALRCAIQHPSLVRRLVLVSFPFRRGGWFPEVLTGMDQVGRDGFSMMQQSPMYEAWLAVAPDAAAFPELMDKTGALLRRPYDWSEEIAKLATPTLLIFGDADSVSPSHAAEFFALLGGGKNDPGFGGTSAIASRLSILPGRTHYDILDSPYLARLAAEFTA